MGMANLRRDVDGDFPDRDRAARLELLRRRAMVAMA
jgi:hypothetical protein